MTTTPEKPVRRTTGRHVPELPPPPPVRQAPPVLPVARAAPPTSSKNGRGKKQGGISDAEAMEAVQAFQAHTQAGDAGFAPPPIPPDAAATGTAERENDEAREKRFRSYPWYERGESRIIDHPDKRLLDPIRKPLEKIGHRLGVRPYQFFSDWLEITELTLKHLPGHLAHARKTGKSEPFPPGTPQEEIDRWMAIFPRYGDKDAQAFVYQQFGEAFGALLDAAETGMADFIGSLYQDMELTDKQYRAQYFTPMSVAFMMALMTQPAHNVYEHLYLALTHPENIAGQALLMASSLFTLQPREGQEDEDKPVVEALGAGVGDFFFEKLLPAALPYYEPIKICDPCIGSGVLMIAAAAAMPPWMSEMGLVQYYGMDTDMLCVRMANINMMLYSLNGFAYKCWEAGQDEAALEALCDPARETEWATIHERLEAERAAQRAAREAEEEKIHKARAEAAKAGGAGLRIEVEEEEDAHGRKKTKKTLKSADGSPQMQLF